MLFRYTENPPENRVLAPGFLRLSGWRMGYTENSSFPYTTPVGQISSQRVKFAPPIVSTWHRAVNHIC